MIWTCFRCAPHCVFHDSTSFLHCALHAGRSSLLVLLLLLLFIFYGVTLWSSTTTPSYVDSDFVVIDDHLHSTPRTLRRPLVHLGVQVSDNIRRDVIIPIF